MPFLTILTQQGGQIRDSFGGTREALVGVSRGLASMVGPGTLSAAAVGALALAWYDGTKQSEAFAKALVLSRNEAALTQAALVQLAADAAESQNATVGAGADAAIAIAKNGQIARANLDAVARAAVAMARLNGQSADETVKAFAKLGDEPLKAAQELNEHVAFLTAELYEQIRALQEHGRNQEAAALATAAASKATVKALNDVRASQNWIGRGWEQLAVKASKAWQAMKGSIGVESPAEEMRRLLNENQLDVQTMNRGLADGMSHAWVASYESAIKTRAARVKEIAGQLSKDAAAAAVTAAQSTSVETLATFDDIIDAQASNAQKRQREIAQVEGAAEIAIAKARAAGLTQVVTDLEEKREQALQAIRDKYAEKADTGTKAHAAKLTDEQRAVQLLASSYLSVTEQLERQIALSGDGTELGRLNYEMSRGNLQGLSAEQQARVRNLAQTSDAITDYDAIWGGDALVEKTRSATDQMSEFSRQAARNMQTAFADYLFDPFSQGADGMLEDFGNTLQRMAAEAAASEIFKAVGTWATGYSGAGQGWINAIGGVIGGGQVKRYAEGGYTGPGGMFEPAGIVHKGEGVLSQRDVAAIGGPAGFLQLVNSIRNRPSYANGGLVGANVAATPLARAGGVSVEIQNFTGQQVTQERQMQRMPDGRELEKIIVKVGARNIAQGGEMAGAIAGRFETKTRR